ncbi:uncharacterized protein LOC18028201 isoform X2 [Eutrema salsugineum]|uniref:uncharacterized protein LOC18028201 isoform X2 n=1 Tax=Eutrema salsugineum TaxID=72664 RepID=UPI000CED1C5D|nr:uncharacterized protein LOC18028201 isoform X2 [Eutrema salsugineum]
MSNPNYASSVEPMPSSHDEPMPSSHDEPMPSSHDEPMSAEISPVETKSSGSSIPVFWDLVDFPFPRGLGPVSIYQNLKTILESMGCVGDLSIMAYVDEKNLRDEWRDVAYKNAGINIVVPPQGDVNYERSRFMLLDIVLWKCKNRSYHIRPLSLLLTLTILYH